MLEIFYKRRSIRKFKNEEVPTEKLDRIMQAALLAPSSKSKYPCEFIVIDDKDTNEKLAECKPHGAGFLKNAPISIVVAADCEKSDVWIEDSSIAATMIQIQAEKEHLGSCWVQIRERPRDLNQSSEEYIQELLQIPENYKILAIIAIGIKEGEKEGRNEDHLRKEKLHTNNF